MEDAQSIQDDEWALVPDAAARPLVTFAVVAARPPDGDSVLDLATVDEDPDVAALADVPDEEAVDFDAIPDA